MRKASLAEAALACCNATGMRGPTVIWGLRLRMRRKGSSRRASASLPPRVLYEVNSCTNFSTGWRCVSRGSMRPGSSASQAASASNAGPCQSCEHNACAQQPEGKALSDHTQNAIPSMSLEASDNTMALSSIPLQSLF